MGTAGGHGTSFLRSFLGDLNHRTCVQSDVICGRANSHCDSLKILRVALVAWMFELMCSTLNLTSKFKHEAEINTIFWVSIFEYTCGECEPSLAKIGDQRWNSALVVWAFALLYRSHQVQRTRAVSPSPFNGVRAIYLTFWLNMSI